MWLKSHLYCLEDLKINIVLTDPAKNPRPSEIILNGGHLDSDPISEIQRMLYDPEAGSDDVRIVTEMPSISLQVKSDLHIRIVILIRN